MIKRINENQIVKILDEAKVNWSMSEQDVLDIFSMLSMIYRKIDRMIKIPQR